MSEYGWLLFDSPDGQRKTRVAIVGRTKGGRVRIRALEPTQLGGVDRWLEVGDEATVSRAALEFVGELPADTKE